MPRPRVYVETTIPSYYFDERQARRIVARRHWTRAWWNIAVERYELTTGPPVYTELSNGPTARQSEWLSLVKPLAILEVSETIKDVAEAYIREKLMPSSGEDALHLAIASVHSCDFLLSWDTRHLANVRKAPHIRRVNRRLGLFVPTLLTPMQMLERSP